MSSQDRLADAAIALNRVLTEAGIRYGLVGGYPISLLGSARTCKNVNCLAQTSKDEIIVALNGRDGFTRTLTNNERQDYASFLWSDRIGWTQDWGRDAVLVEVFCEQFTGAQYSMQNVRIASVTVNSRRATGQAVSILDPFFQFKYMLRAAAYRNKLHDEFDLQWLSYYYRQVIAAGAQSLNYEIVGLALRNYASLDDRFAGAGIDVNYAKQCARGVRLDAVAVLGNVQRGILG
ncbi:hypothetical protein BDV96DRAFT_594691 [Lophiotrema nucula]|uniref:Uncharacterized protein n=1 Tax=Lophiotrema nucula TaxID=690887 RepID=A0A6A5ZRL6_9PLEO|nr:hypothetical protein BDV96DRAFT_594691 [Lophiotrema nucula]